jgi:hypothetical protein
LIPAKAIIFDEDEESVVEPAATANEVTESSSRERSMSTTSVICFREACNSVWEFHLSVPSRRLLYSGRRRVFFSYDFVSHSAATFTSATTDEKVIIVVGVEIGGVEWIC